MIFFLPESTCIWNVILNLVSIEKKKKNISLQCINIYFSPKFTYKHPFLEKLQAPRAFISDNAYM